MEAGEVGEVAGPLEESTDSSRLSTGEWGNVHVHVLHVVGHRGNHSICAN